MKKLFISLLMCSLIFCFIGCDASDAQQATIIETLPEGTVAVATAEELINAFSDLKTDDCILLKSDIDMEGKSLSVVNMRSFTLDGNGHTISNYKVTDASGLFVDYCGDRAYTIRNLTLKNCSVISEDDHAALFVGGARDSDSVLIENCHAVNCRVSGKKYASIFISYTAGMDKGNEQTIPMQIIDCSVINCEVTGGGSTGIAIGHSGGNQITENTIRNLSIKNCTVTGPASLYEGAVIGTSGSGVTIIENVIIENTTLSYNESEGVRSYFGRNLSELIIDGVIQDKTVNE